MQLDLFSPHREELTPPVVAPARRTDPQSSKRAGAEMVTSGAAQSQADRIEQMVHRQPGLTADEIAKAIGDLDRVQVGKRLPHIPSVRRGDESVARKCSVSKRHCCTWWPKHLVEE